MVSVVLPVEHLEARLLLAADPTVYEQYMLSLVNRARANPLAEAARYGINLNEGVPADELISSAPKQALAFNPYLNEAADGHTAWMLAVDVFDHTGAGGTSPGERDALAGYQFIAPYAWGENLAYSGYFGFLPEQLATIEQLHENLFVDEGIADRGHRTAMLGDHYRETGIGIADGEFTTGQGDALVWMLTQEFATTAGSAFITGLAWADTIRRDGLFTPFEGLGGVTVEASALDGSAVYSTMSWDAGGYSLQVPPGDYAVRASGGDLFTALDYGVVSIGNENVLADFNATGYADMPILTDAGVVLVIGTPGPDYIGVQDLGDRVRVHRNGGSIHFMKSAVNALEIHASGGDDYVEIWENLSITGIYGDDGNDTILGGSNTDYIGGGDGDDVISGRFGDDSITGGAGHDLLEGRAGRDSIFGAKGRDSIFGGNHDDSLWGAKAADYIDGQAGNDTLSGGGNHDTLIGGSGNDLLLAADNTYDALDGGDGHDSAVLDPLIDSIVNLEL